MTVEATEIKNALANIQNEVEGAIKKVETQVAEDGKATKSAIADMDAKLADHAGMVADLKASNQELKSELTGALQRQTSSIPAGEAKSIGNQFVESDAFKQMKSGVTGRARFELKNTIINSGNDTSRHEQLPGVVPGAFRALTVMPTVMQGQLSSNIVYYSRELSWTNNAAGQVEGQAKAESDLTFEEIDTSVRTIAHFLKTSKQAMDDSTFLASYIDQRMRHGINNVVEQQIIQGDGTGQNLSGWLATGNHVITNAANTVDIFGLANKMKYEIIAADYMPDYYYFNPLDWAAMETQRRGSDDNTFTAGGGAVTYVDNGMTPLLWGIPVVVSNNVPAGNIICKSMDADMYGQRQGTVVETFEQDGTNVQSNLLTIRAETRGAELVFTPAAIRLGVIANITP